ncbi:hypothetical protein Tco_0031128 [Tanacetum coccineum]
MATLQFADTHNLVAFLSKPAESKGFEQIVDFLNANPIRYALTINPTIYTSCIEQLWATVKAKTVNEDVHAKTTKWNELSSTMASAIICLATNQKFNFSKYIFECMVKSLENMSGKFLMYPRFVQVFLEKQLGEFQNHKILCYTSTLKKIFRNMRRVGKGFSRREIPLFQIMVVQHQEEMGEGSANPTDPHHTPTIIQPSISQRQKKQKPRRPKRKDTKIPQFSGHTDNVTDEAANEEMDDSLERAAITATSIDAKQDRGNINKTQSKATPNEPSSLGTSSGGGPRRQETIGIQLLRLAQEITSLKLRVKKLEKKGGSRTHKLKRLCKVGRSARIVSSDEDSLGDQEDASKQKRKIDNINKDAEITLVDETQGRYGDDLMFDTGVLNDDEVFIRQDMDEKEINVVEKEVSTADPVTTAGEVVTTASPTETTTADDLTLVLNYQQQYPKLKGLLFMNKSKHLHQQFLHNNHHNSIFRIKARVEADYQLAQRLQAQEQEELTDKEKARLFVQFLEQRRKHFAAKRAEEKRNRPPTRAQQRSFISKRAGTGLEQESIKKQKVDENKETTELQRLIEVVPDKEEVAIDSIPLATKPPSIVDYKIHKEGKKTYYQIIRADGSSKMYLVFSHMLKSFDKEDLETLWKLVKAKHGSTRPEEGYKKVI